VNVYITVLSEILAARVCGGSKFAKNKIIRKMLDRTASLNIVSYSRHWQLVSSTLNPGQNRRKMSPEMQPG
jgi:hypothetical protein